MAKTNNGGFVPPKGKPSGSGRNTHGLKDALAVNDADRDNELAENYTDGEDEPSENIHVRQNRNVDKGRENQSEETKS